MIYVDLLLINAAFGIGEGGSGLYTNIYARSTFEVIRSLTFHIGTKQYSEEEGISESAASILYPDVVSTSRDDICDRKIAGLC